MNASQVLLIALALCLCASPALAVGKFYESKIVPYNMTEELAALPQNLYGTLSGHLRCSDNFLTPKVGIKNQANPNGTFTFFPILSDGRFGDLDGSIDIRLIPGRYDLYLPDGNGGQPEYSTALITAGMTSYPERELLGHAYAGTPEQEEVGTCRLVIDSARYGIRKGTPLDGHPGVEAEKTVWSWVGWKLRPLIENDQLFVSATYPELHYNSLFGDPYEGVFKKLIVRFHYDCGECQQEQEQFTTDSIREPCYTQHRVCVWEDEDLVITPATENKWCIPDAPDEDQTPQ